MNTFYIYQKAANGSREPEVSIVDLIPIGKENAIKREELIVKCVYVGLIAETIVDKDRKMRNLIAKAKLDYSITNDGDGAGYYRPTREEQKQLSRNNKREDRRAIATFRGTKVSKALEADYKAGRLDE